MRVAFEDATFSLSDGAVIFIDVGNEFLGKSGVAFESEVGPEMLEGSGVVVVADGATVDEDVDGGRDGFLSDGFFDERSEIEEL